MEGVAGELGDLERGPEGAAVRCDIRSGFRRRSHKRRVDEDVKPGLHKVAAVGSPGRRRRGARGGEVLGDAAIPSSDADALKAREPRRAERRARRPEEISRFVATFRLGPTFLGPSRQLAPPHQRFARFRHRDDHVASPHARLERVDDFVYPRAIGNGRTRGADRLRRQRRRRQPTADVVGRRLPPSDAARAPLQRSERHAACLQREDQRNPRRSRGVARGVGESRGDEAQGPAREDDPAEIRRGRKPREETHRL